MNHMGVAVIEGRWDKNLNLSVKNLFDLLGNIFYGNPNSYHYEMFNSCHSLQNITLRTASQARIKHIYLAAHGDNDGIGTEDDGIISRTKIRNIFRNVGATAGATLDGLFFDSCLFCNCESARYLFAKDATRQTKLKWIAGYSESVDWIQSSAVDMIFWHAYLFRKHNQPNESEATRIKAVGSHIMRFAPGAYNELGFNIYTRGARGIVSPLIHR